MRFLTSLFSRFAADSRGAVNIDWVAITSAILVLGIATIYGIYASGVDPVVDQVTAVMDDVGEL